ncbi:hypothetical protein V5799_024697, partial [Amblyomma americanum]
CYLPDVTASWTLFNLVSTLLWFAMDKNIRYILSAAIQKIRDIDEDTRDLGIHRRLLLERLVRRWRWLTDPSSDTSEDDTDSEDDVKAPAAPAASCANHKRQRDPSHAIQKIRDIDDDPRDQGIHRRLLLARLVREWQWLIEPSSDSGEGDTSIDDTSDDDTSDDDNTSEDDADSEDDVEAPGAHAASCASH